MHHSFEVKLSFMFGVHELDVPPLSVLKLFIKPIHVQTKQK